MNRIDRLLNSITMYRLVVYVLGILTVAAVISTFMGKLSASPTLLLISLGLCIISTYITDRGCGRLFGVPANQESALITALILFLIVQPAHSLMTGIALVLAGVIACATKFLLTYNARHVFNPAAFGAAVVSLTGLQATTWWVGNSLFWPLSLLLGLAVVRKMRKLPLVLSFVAVSVLLQLVVFIHAGQPLVPNMRQALIASPLIFLATIMLTEPATMPPRRNQQLVFGAIVAVLYVMAWHIGPLIIYPEVALLLGNLFAFAVSPKFRLRLKLLEVEQISNRVFNYVFQPERPFHFLPGQYMEWTLDNVPYDSRGNRRTFTIASSPTESSVQLGLKYQEPASMFKATFAQLRPGDIIHASQLAGNFTLNGNENRKLVFIAGGIGITPFRSMIKYIVDKNITVDIVLLYVVGDPNEFAYTTLLHAAHVQGVKLIPIITNPAYHADGAITAKLNDSLVIKLVPDYNERLFYISGPSNMVDATQELLHALHIPRTHIKTDHFSGY